MTPGDRRIGELERRLDRERRARAEAERIAERTTSALYERQRELEMLEAVATAANEASTVEHALQVAVDVLCGYVGWPVGHAYVRNAEGWLESSKLWFDSDSDRFADFRRVSEAQRFRSGEGLPGRVLARREAVWVEDVRAYDNFPRIQVLPEAGIRAGFAFPVLLGGEPVAVIELFSDRVTPCDEALLRLTDRIGASLGLVMERLNAQAKLAHAAMHDGLTGLPNRELFLDRLQLALARAKRREGLVAVMFIDLDGFKNVNDSAGHHAGDLLLREVARRLDEGLRSEDTVARLGGDEFVILSEDLGDEREAVELAERLQRLLLTPIVLASDEEHLITASIGIATADRGEADAEALMSDADAAMYRAKDRGRARHEVFNESMRDRVLTRLRTERALRRAIENDELSLHYQPIVGLDGTGAIQGVEALVRWNDPEVGMRPPADFIPVAEESSLILKVGEWVLREACRHAAAWRRHPRRSQLLPVHVNLAARQLGDPGLPDVVRAAVLEAGLNPRDLALEITESALIENSDVPAATLAELRSLGVRVLLDDFGTGYSSLGYLHRFPVDVLKIDRSFVSDLGTDDSAAAIVQAIVGMGHSLGIEVVAEGIETAQQAAEAERLGCDSGQGFLYARPAPMETLAAAMA